MTDVILDTLIEIFDELEGDSDMAISVRKACDLRSEGKSLLIYAHSGTGKTHALGTLPEGKTLVLDLDQGVETLAQTQHDVVRPTSLADLNEVYEGLRDGSLAYRFVGIDSLTELEKLLQTGRKQLKGKEFLSMKEYGESAELIRELVRKFRDLRNQGINTVFTALEMVMDIQVSESDVVTRSVPFLSRKFALEACGLMDMVARLVINPNSGQRELHFAGNDKFIAKTRVHVVEPIEPADLTALYRKIFGIKPKPEEAASEEPAKTEPKPKSKKA